MRKTSVLLRRIKDKKNKEDKDDSVIMICHKPGTGAERTMIVAKSTSSGHLGHGDTEGECPGDSGSGR
jgi:hypothetical protein